MVELVPKHSALSFGLIGAVERRVALIGELSDGGRRGEGELVED